MEAADHVQAKQRLQHQTLLANYELCIIVQVSIAPNRDLDHIIICFYGLGFGHSAWSGRNSPRGHNAAGGGKETALHSPLRFVLASKGIYLVHR